MFAILKESLMFIVQCSIISEFSDVQCSMFNVHCSKTNVHHVQCSTEHEQTSNIEHECSMFGDPCRRDSSTDPCNGVYLNRNFDFNFDANMDCSHDEYGGESAESEDESKDLIKLMNQVSVFLFNVYMY